MMPEQMSNLTGVAIAQSDATVISPPLKAIDLFEGGTLKVRDTSGVTHALTLPTMAEGGTYPYRLWLRVDMVFATDTAITDAEMLGIR